MNLAQQMEIAYQRNEQALAARNAAPLEVDRDDQRLLARFAKFCKDNGVRPLPAAPGTIAAWIAGEDNPPETIVRTLQAIEAVHSNNNLANPVACAAPRAVLSKILKLEGPRSWSKAERLALAACPIEIREIVERRTKRDSDLIRQLQNENSELRKSINSNQKEIDSNVRQEKS
jgi:hypothetical protein